MGISVLTGLGWPDLGASKLETYDWGLGLESLRKPADSDVFSEFGPAS